MVGHSQLELLSNRTGPRATQEPKSSCSAERIMARAAQRWRRLKLRPSTGAAALECCAVAEGLMLSSLIDVIVLRHRRVYGDC